MKKLIPVVALILLVGCSLTTKRITYNTLASTQISTTAAYDGYLDLVVKGKMKTNSVPEVARKYNMFQVVWNAAVVVAQWNTNSVAPPAVNNASTAVFTAIMEAK